MNRAGKSNSLNCGLVREEARQVGTRGGGCGGPTGGWDSQAFRKGCGYLSTNNKGGDLGRTVWF